MELSRHASYPLSVEFMTSSKEGGISSKGHPL